MPTPRSRLGAKGEELARKHLTAKGYKVLTNNFRSRDGEVDIVALDRDCLVFVEVRTKRGTDFGTPQESLTPKKQEKLILVSEAYIQTLDRRPDDWRIDLIAVSLSKRGVLEDVEHFENAVELA